MRFTLLDEICSYEPDVQLTATKGVTLAEEYLGDHFPDFPVLPGVLMLEAAAQASAWLLRLSEDFTHSMVLLKEVRNVKYADFVAPGNSLQIHVTLTNKDDRLAKFKFRGKTGEQTSVSGRLTMERFNLADDDPSLAIIDQHLSNHFRDTRALLLRRLESVSQVD